FSDRRRAFLSADSFTESLIETDAAPRPGRKNDQACLHPWRRPLLWGCPEKEILCIEVADTGPGIPPEQLPDIFEPFRRGSAGQETGTERAGLGLSIAKQLVTSMGGQISVTSTLNVGSTFTTCLPLEGAPRR
ncbi:MAG: ATP-binding protein, partial [Anaerolineales bacterium]